MWTSIGEFLKKSYPFIIEGFLIFIILYVRYKIPSKTKKLLIFLFFILFYLVFYI